MIAVEKQNSVFDAENQELVDKSGAAWILGDISVRTVDNLVTRKLLIPVKIFRRTLFRRKDLVALAKRGAK